MSLRERYHENVSSRCFYKRVINPAAVIVEKEWLDADLMQRLKITYLKLLL